MKSKIFITLFISSLLLLLVQPVKSCGFYESEADYRAMMFRAMLPGMKCMQPFRYTMSSMYFELDWDVQTTDPDKNDRYRNCTEWKSACDQSVLMEDIYKIQYNTNGKLFVNAFGSNTWQDDFPGNTFIRFLTKKENKDLLEYMLLAKKIEMTEGEGSSRFEEWDSPSTYQYYYQQEWYTQNIDSLSKVKKELLKTAWKNLNSVSSRFLQQRYAFQVCRLDFQVGTVPGVDPLDKVYKKYFGDIDPNNLMSIWATLFRASNTPAGRIDRYRDLIHVFDNSDEKKFRCVQLFDNSYNAASLTSSEQSVAVVMESVRNPGRALDQICKAYKLDKNNKHIPFLVLREINKLEDWLITPIFYDKYSYSQADFFRKAFRNPWEEEYKKEQSEEDQDETGKKLQSENLVTDYQYMAQLKTQLIQMLSESSGETKDFYAISLAHLSLLQENVPDARKYLSMVSEKANATIKLQKNIEAIWMAIKIQDVNSDAFKTTYLKNIADLEKISTPDYENNQILYTLTLSLANEYLNKNNRLYGDLMRSKSDTYHHPLVDAGWIFDDDSEPYYDVYRSGDTYFFVRYFDGNATISDMDGLIALIEKKGRTPFEQYLCSQPFASVNAYKDLKGTIAFRNNDLQLAYTTFASMPQDYWQSDRFSFSGYLNEDPFIPKGLRSNKYRRFDYKFNKAEFVKELIELQKSASSDKTKSVDNYIKLGDAYFNTSYWGNAWMMTRYSSSTSDLYYSKIEYLPQWMRDYMTAGIARSYYEKALKEAANDDQRAYSLVMLSYIYRLCYGYINQESDKTLAFDYGNRFMNYGQTKIFKMYECPGIKDFLTVKNE